MKCPKASTLARWRIGVWLILGVPGFTVWLDSVPWVNFMSYYAIIVSELAVVAASKAQEATDADRQ